MKLFPYTGTLYIVVSVILIAQVESQRGPNDNVDQINNDSVNASTQSENATLTSLPTSEDTTQTTTLPSSTTTTTTTTEVPTIPLMWHPRYGRFQGAMTGILYDAISGVRVPAGDLQPNEFLAIVLQNVDVINIIKRIFSQDDIRNFLPLPESVSTRCYNDTVDFIDGLIGQREAATSKEYITTAWAFRMIDAFGKPAAGILHGPSHWVGSYDQCFDTHAQIQQGAFLGSRPTARDLTTEFKGRYCRVEFLLPGRYIPFDNFQQPGFWAQVASMPLRVHVGMCLPNTCHDRDVQNLLIQGNLVPTPLSVSDVICFDKDDDLSSDGWAIFAICLLSTVGGIVVVCTVVDSAIFYGFISVSTKNDSPSDNNLTKGTEKMTLNDSRQMYGGVSKPFEEVKSLERYDGSVQNGSTDSKSANLRTPLKNDSRKKDLIKGDIFDEPDAKSHTKGNEKKANPSTGVLLIESFSLHNNWMRLFSTSSNKDTMLCVQGLRTIAIIWIVLGHTFLYDSVQDPKNIMISMLDQVPKMLDRLSFTFIVGTMMSVDFFFVISGMLIMKLTLRKLRKSDHQGPAFWILFYGHRLWRLTPVYMMVLMTGTTLYDHMVDGPLKAEPNDLFRHCKTHWWTNLLYINNLVKPLQMCMVWSWYLAADVQLFAISPIFILLVHRKYKYGIWFLLATIGLGTIGTFVASFENPGQILTGTYVDDSYAEHVYFVPWPRLAVFAMGMLLGVVLENPDLMPTISKVKALAIWFVLGGITLFLIMIPHDQWKDEGDLWPKGTQSVYEASCRFFWSLFAAWIIYSCQSGIGGIASIFLQWPGFIVLGRLTYTVYLVHPMVITFFLYERTSPIDPFDTMIIYTFCGNLIMSYLVATLYHLVFEAPLLGLEKIFLGRK